MMRSSILSICSLALLSFFCSRRNPAEINQPDWLLGPFTELHSAYPVIERDQNTKFLCPVRRTQVNWEAKDVFNPAAVVKDGKMVLLYRAEDTVGRYAGTSRIGLAWSTDGLHFTRESKPVLYPARDFMRDIEWEGGCEDPRVVEDENGIYYMTYTGFNGHSARLCVAVSKDLYEWEKKGAAFARAFNGKYRKTWSKSGSIVCRLDGEKLVAAKINGAYWMYWGDSTIFLATSDDLVNWTPVEKRHEAAKLLEYTGNDFNVHISYGESFLFPVFTIRANRFDSRLVEPGPPALWTANGILFIYNSANDAAQGDPSLPDGSYAAGQVLLDPADPASIIGRTTRPFMIPDMAHEKTGQTDNVCYLEGLAFYQGSWWLYYGTADSKIAVAKYTP